jgi:hypothetical protein
MVDLVGKRSIFVLSSLRGGSERKGEGSYLCLLYAFTSRPQRVVTREDSNRAIALTLVMYKTSERAIVEPLLWARRRVGVC